MLRLVLQIKGKGDTRILMPGVRRPFFNFLIKAILPGDILWEFIIHPAPCLSALPPATPSTPAGFTIFGRTPAAIAPSSPTEWAGRPDYLGRETRLGLLTKSVVGLAAAGISSATFEASTLRYIQFSSTLDFKYRHEGYLYEATKIGKAQRALTLDLADLAGTCSSTSGRAGSANA